MKKTKIYVTTSWPRETNPDLQKLLTFLQKQDIEIIDGTEIQRWSNENLAGLHMLRANAVCIIVTPKDTDVVSKQTEFEINLAKSFEIPIFIMADWAYMGHPIVKLKVGALKSGFYSPAIFEFKRLLWEREAEEGRDQEFTRMATFIKKILGELNTRKVNLKKSREGKMLGLIAKRDRIAPLHTVIQMIADAHDQNPKIAFDLTAQACAMATDADFAFVAFKKRGIPDYNGFYWNKLEVKGWFGKDRERSIEALNDLKLGYGNQTKKREIRGVSGYTALTGQPFIHGNLQNEKGELKRKTGIDFLDPSNMGIASELCVPIKVRGKVIGVIDIESVRLGQFDEFSEINVIILECLAGVIAESFKKNQLEDFIEHLPRLKSEESGILDTALEYLLDFTQADHGFIAKKNNKTEEFEVLGITKHELNLSKPVEPTKGLCGAAIEFKVIRTLDLVTDEVQEYFNLWDSTKANMAIPILSREGEAVGVVNLEFDYHQDFKFWNLSFYQSIANIFGRFIG